METIENLRNLGINVNRNASQQKVRCPKCIQMGKENWKDTCLSINLNEGLYYCHKCGWEGRVKTTNNMENIRVYKKPTKANMSKITANGKQFLNARGITDEVIARNKIVSSKDDKAVIFPYFVDGEMVNTKTRYIDGKRFIQSRDAEPVVYNYDSCKDQDIIVICEGEMDSLSWEVAGVEFHTSVNMGAPNPNDKNIDRKLECLNTCWNIFESAKTVYVATDNDENGRVLQKELVRRIGADKCLLVDFSPYKDANEVLLSEGIESLQNRLKTASNPKVEGIFSIDDVRESMLDTFHNGQERGTTTYFPSIDKAWTWRNGEVNIWTGYQNEGKSIFINQLATVKAAYEGWRFGVFSPENMPMNDFFNDIIEMYMGKSSDPSRKNQMSLDEYNKAMDFVKKHFFIIYPKAGFTLEEIFERAKFLVKTKGIRSLIIDPYNTVQHRMRHGEREDLYISRFMSELKRFALDNNISIHLVAHQNTPRRGDDGKYPKPDVNNIKGGGTFADKADNVMFIWRPNRAVDFSDPYVLFGSQKIKKQKLVGIPQEIDGIMFDIRKQRYYIDGLSPFNKIDEIRNQQ